jgi:hypothetical protein
LPYFLLANRFESWTLTRGNLSHDNAIAEQHPLARPQVRRREARARQTSGDRASILPGPSELRASCLDSEPIHARRGCNSFIVAAGQKVDQQTTDRCKDTSGASLGLGPAEVNLSIN